MSEVPDWMERKIAERNRNIVLKIRAGKPQFWGQTFERIDNNVKFLPKLGANGRIANLTTIADKQQRYRLDVGCSGRVPSLTYTDLFYTVGSAVITCRTQEDESSTFRFALSPGGKLGVIPDDEYIWLDAKAFADRILREAVERLSV